MTDHTSRNSITVAQNGVSFNVVKPAHDFGGIGSNGLYTNAEEQAAAGSAVNAVDIDWDHAIISTATAKDIKTSITNTGELLGVIKMLNDRIDALESAFSTLAQNVGSLVTITNGE